MTGCKTLTGSMGSPRNGLILTQLRNYKSKGVRLAMLRFVSSQHFSRMELAYLSIPLLLFANSQAWSQIVPYSLF